MTRNGETIDLTPREFTLLDYFMRNPGRVLSRTMIAEHVWDYNFDPRTNVVDVLVFRLREKIDRRSRDHSFIQTRYGVGYKLDPAPK